MVVPQKLTINIIKRSTFLREKIYAFNFEALPCKYIYIQNITLINKEIFLLTERVE